MGGVIVMLLWVVGGAMKDILMYFRMQWFVLKCEISGRAAIENETMWLVVDKPGLISLKWYDTLVMRNRYSHMVARTRCHSCTAAADGEKEIVGTAWISENKQVETRLVVEDQNAAHAQWLGFHENFARFVAQISLKPVSPNFMAEMAQRDKESKSAAQMFMEMDEDGSGSLELPEITELCYRLNPKLKRTTKDLHKIVEEMDIDGDGEIDLDEFTRWWAKKGFADRSDADAGSAPGAADENKAANEAVFGGEPARRGFKHLEPVASLLEQMYTTHNLANMVLYMEYAIKYGLADKCELKTIGPSDIASHLIQFTREFAEALAGGAQGNSVASQEGFSQPGIEASAGASGETELGSLDEGRADKWYPVLRPYRAMGIDMAMFHTDGKAVRRHPKHARTTRTARDFANPMHATAFALHDADTLAQVSSRMMQ